MSLCGVKINNYLFNYRMCPCDFYGRWYSSIAPKISKYSRIWGLNFIFGEQNLNPRKFLLLFIQYFPSPRLTYIFVFVNLEGLTYRKSWKRNSTENEESGKDGEKEIHRKLEGSLYGEWGFGYCSESRDPGLVKYLGLKIRNLEICEGFEFYFEIFQKGISYIQKWS